MADKKSESTLDKQADVDHQKNEIQQHLPIIGQVVPALAALGRLDHSHSKHVSSVRAQRVQSIIVEHGGHALKKTFQLMVEQGYGVSHKVVDKDGNVVMKENLATRFSISGNTSKLTRKMGGYAADKLGLKNNKRISRHSTEVVAGAVGRVFAESATKIGLYAIAYAIAPPLAPVLLGAYAAYRVFTRGGEAVHKAEAIINKIKHKAKEVKVDNPEKPFGQCLLLTVRYYPLTMTLFVLSMAAVMKNMHKYSGDAAFDLGKVAEQIGDKGAEEYARYFIEKSGAQLEKVAQGLGVTAFLTAALYKAQHYGATFAFETANYTAKEAKDFSSHIPHGGHAHPHHHHHHHKKHAQVTDEAPAKPEQQKPASTQPQRKRPAPGL